MAASHWCSGAQVLSVQADLGSEVPSGGPVYGGRSVARAESIFDTAELVERRPLVESIVNQRAARVSISIDRDCDDAGPLAALITTGALDGRFATIDLALPGRASDATHDGVDPRDGAGTDVTGDGAERATPVVFTGLGAASMLTPLYTNIG
ncbi:MAG: hypothetical protein M5T61_03065 [Acidimicrobiia bacterium]|nr:hypothetical protein [Acidimicrobiia bacterium]